MMDPGKVLGVPPTATDEEIRAAYLQKVREHPPDRSPERFEEIRDAYNCLCDARRRIEHRLFSLDPAAPLASLAAEVTRQHRYVGPRPWLEVLRGK